MKTSNEFIARQCDQSGELVECIRSGQASAEQVEAHYAAGDVVMLCAEPAIAQPVQPAQPCITCAAIHVILDADESMIIRNAKDGYPEGRTPRALTLVERVVSLCKYAADWKRWCIKAQATPQPAPKQGEVK